MSEAFSFPSFALQITFLTLIGICVVDALACFNTWPSNASEVGSGHVVIHSAGYHRTSIVSDHCFFQRFKDSSAEHEPPLDPSWSFFEWFICVCYVSTPEYNLAYRLRHEVMRYYLLTVCLA